jgi:hypothetical protein
MKNEKIFWCKNCLNLSTRPRLTFDNGGLKYKGPNKYKKDSSSELAVDIIINNC